MGGAVRATGHGRRRDEVPPAALDAPATALEEARERVGGCLRSGRWREALVACLETDVGLVPEVVDQVGNRAFDAGEFEALWQALSGLPSAVQSHPNVAY